jgi:hypothetical protein
MAENGVGRIWLPISMVDDLFFEAAKAVTAAGCGTVSLLMNELGIHYYHAAELIAALQDAGILGPYSEDFATLELLRPIGFF